MEKVGKTTRPFRCDLNQIPYSESDKYILGIRFVRVPEELLHCTGGSAQEQPQEKEMLKGKMQKALRRPYK